MAPLRMCTTGETALGIRTATGYEPQKTGLRHAGTYLFVRLPERRLLQTLSNVFPPFRQKPIASPILIHEEDFLR
jgi:hypothetical protein